MILVLMIGVLSAIAGAAGVACTYIVVGHKNQNAREIRHHEQTMAEITAAAAITDTENRRVRAIESTAERDRLLVDRLLRFGTADKMTPEQIVHVLTTRRDLAVGEQDLVAKWGIGS